MIHYKYRFQDVTPDFIGTSISIIFDDPNFPPNNYLITTSFGSDIQSSLPELQGLLKEYNLVMAGEIPSFGTGGNLTFGESYRDITILEDCFYDEEEDGPQEFCKIPTTDFMILLFEWAKQDAIMKQNKNRISKEECQERITWIDKQLKVLYTQSN